jgi:protein gp37
MAENSAISWTRHTWNPWMGCTKISSACDGCYAEALMDKRYNKVKWGNAPRVRTGAHTWNDPFRWQRQAERDGDRPFVFCASLADIFDNRVDPQWRADAFDVMRKTPRLVYLLLTKRPQLIVKLADAVGGLPSNAALGTTVEDQKRADINLPALQVAKIETKPLFTFGSFEPLLGPIVIPPAFMPDWVITGGETDQGGHKSRPTHPEWFRSLRDQALAAGAAFHHKQNGEWVPLRENGDGEWPTDNGGFCRLTFSGEKAAGGWPMQKVGKKRAGRLLDGVTHDAFPELAE